MRVLIVGLGSIGRRHARIVRELIPQASIVALRHGPDKEPVAGVDRCVGSVAEALEFRPQIAVIANPASHHVSVATLLAEAGVHLLVEKPIASSSEGVANLIDVCRTKSLVLMTGYNLRFLPCLNLFREIIVEGHLGRILSVRAESGGFLPSWRPAADYRETVSAKKELGGGVLLELSHELDYLRWIFGDVAWVSALARKQSDLEINVEDTVHAILGFKMPSEKPVIASVLLDFARHDVTRSCYASGTNGSVRWNAIEGTVDICKPAGAWKTVFSQPSERDFSYRQEWQHFLNCIENEDTPIVGGEDGLDALKVVEAIRASSELGSRCDVA